MTITITLEYWQAVRLQALVCDGREILSQQGRSQRGIDGYTQNDLSKLDELFLLKDSPSIVPKIELK